MCWSNRLQSCNAPRCGEECPRRIRPKGTLAPLARQKGVATSGASSRAIFPPLYRVPNRSHASRITYHGPRTTGRNRASMIHLKPITIIGGGLAGLTLGIGLRRQGIPATIWEAGHYPRHRVCGEFISGDGQDSLKRLGLWEHIVEAGASVARTSAFFS